MMSFRRFLPFLLLSAVASACLDSEDEPPPVEDCGERPAQPALSYREDDTGYHVTRSTFDALLQWQSDISAYANCVAWELSKRGGD